jgi:hypothetical protein
MERKTRKYQRYNRGIAWMLDIIVSQRVGTQRVDEVFGTEEREVRESPASFQFSPVRSKRCPVYNSNIQLSAQLGNSVFDSALL